MAGLVTDTIAVQVYEVRVRSWSLSSAKCRTSPSSACRTPPICLAFAANFPISVIAPPLRRTNPAKATQARQGAVRRELRKIVPISPTAEST
jgi:hypothetical protein